MTQMRPSHPDGRLTIKAKDLDFRLPPERIAQHACENRDASRLMVIHRQTGEIEHRIFRDLPAYLRPRDCLVINRTKVLPAKFAVHRRSGGRIEGLFLKEESAGHWLVLLKNAKRLSGGERLSLEPFPGAMIILRRMERGQFEVRIDPVVDPSVILNQIGSAPLPPYIRRDEEEAGRLRQNDIERYQTVYAAVPGAVAAPTAGLHFTAELLDTLRGNGIAIADVVLHVGLGTFQPIEVEDLVDHAMHKEWYDLPADSAAMIDGSRTSGGRTIAIGTTAVRVLETCHDPSGPLHAQSGWTDLFIYPPYSFRAVDVLLTNFHLPASSLLALLCAFAGRQLILEKAYPIAIQEGYRFYSYGDAMLVL